LTLHDPFVSIWRNNGEERVARRPSAVTLAALRAVQRPR